MSRTLLIDGDICIFQVAAACQRPAIDWGDGIYSPEYADLKEAQGRISDYLTDLQQTLEADRLVIALKDGENWRKKLLPTYKQNRSGLVPPMLRAPLHEYLKSKYDAYQRPGLEGDDILGILATHPKLIPGEKVVVSIDKDMKSVPGLLYNPNAPDSGVVEITQHEADYWHMRQTLTGDSTDGYTGCPGVGPVKAQKILAEAGLDNRKTYWDVVVEAYAAKGLSEEVALTMARIARICRATDYDFKKKEVILWAPPSSPVS